MSTIVDAARRPRPRRAPEQEPEPEPQQGPTPRYVMTTGAAAIAVAPDQASAAAPQPDQRPRHLRVVVPAERTRRRLTPATAVLLSAMLFVLLFAVAMAHSVLVEGQVHLDHLENQLVVEQARYQELRKDVAELESPERIVAAAHERGMVTPDDLVYLQPAATDPSAEGPTTGDDTEPSADPSAGAEPDAAWSTIKQMLEAPAP